MSEVVFGRTKAHINVAAAAVKKTMKTPILVGCVMRFNWRAGPIRNAVEEMEKRFPAV